MAGPSGERKESPFDLVVLAPGQHPDAFLAGFAKDHELAVDDWGFVRAELFLPAHTSRPGIFACGGATGPKDIHDSVTGATAAALSAMKVMAEAGRGRDSALALDQEPDQAASFHPRSGGVSLFSGALVIGGGIAGITAALAVADQGFDVDLVEQTGELGGNLVWLTSGIQGAADFLEQQVAAVWTHDRIRVHTRTRAAETTGRPGRWVTRLIPVRDTDRNMGGDTDAKTREQADVPLSGEKAGKASPGESVNQSQDILVRHGVVVLAVGGTEAGPDTVDPDPETGLYTQQQFQQALDGNEIDAGAPLQVAMFQCMVAGKPAGNTVPGFAVRDPWTRPCS